MSTSDVLTNYVATAVASSPATATVTSADDTATFTSGVRKRSRSRSLEFFNGGSENEEDHINIPAPKKPRGRPRCTQPPTRKARKQNKVATKSTATPGQQNSLQSHGKNAIPMSQSTELPSSTKRFPYQEQLNKVIEQCFDSHLSPSFESLQREVTELREIIVSLASRVTELTSLLSASNKIPVPIPCAQPNQQTFAPNAASPQKTVTAHPLSYSAVASAVTTVVNPDNGASHRNRQSTLVSQQSHDDAVTAMYVDQRRKQQRANNIIITGLPHSDDDTRAVTDLLRSEFEWDVNDWPGVGVTSCRRIGQHRENKVQPLIVTLHNNLQSEYYIKNAKYLRSSSDAVINSSVFINPDLTPSEARAAYELRIQRRQRRQQWEEHVTDRNGTSTSRTFFRCSDKPSISIPSLNTSSSTSKTIHPQPDPNLISNSKSSIPSRLVWSSHQTTNPVPFPVIPTTSISVDNVTSPMSLLTPSPSALPDHHDGVKTSISDSSDRVAGSCP